jgi:putative tryptophan/tyrosine transport system substrate-binding protein
MKRRDFITLAGAALLPIARPVALHAQPSAFPLIGFLSGASPAGWESYLAAFHRGLGETGYVEGRNVSIEYRWAMDRYDQLPALAAELVERHATVIVAAGGTRPVLAAKAASTSIPIVFTGIPDPVEARLVASLNRPGGNLTGVGILTTTIIPKRFELLHTLVPNATVFGILVNSASPFANLEIVTARTAAAARGLTLQALQVATETEFEAAFAELSAQRGDALIVSAEPLFNSRRNALIELAARHRIPAMYGWPEYPKAGGLASYGPDLADQYRLCGTYAGRILKGEKAAELPVAQPAKFYYVVNLMTAKALGLDPPGTALAIADEVIE